jgi:hypothetical protein
MASGLGLGITAASAIYGALSKGGSNELDWNSLRRFSDSLQPQGYTTPEDIAAAENTKSRLRRSVGTNAGQQRALALRRAVARGAGTGPAVEATLGRIGEAEALGSERAGATGEEQIYNTRLGREKFGQQKALMLLGGKLRDASSGRSLRMMQHASFVNSLLDLSKTSLGLMGNQGIETKTDASGNKYQSVSDRGGWTNEGEVDPGIG